MTEKQQKQLIKYVKDTIELLKIEDHLAWNDRGQKWYCRSFCEECSALKLMKFVDAL